MKDTFQVPVSIRKIIRDKNGLIKDLVVQEIKPMRVIVNEKIRDIYIQESEPENPAQGDIWIQITN